MSNTEITDVARQVQRWCDIGFAHYDASYYDKIDEALASLEQTEQVQSIRRLAKGGRTLSSPRFAYPHIRDMAGDLLEVMT